MTRGPQIIVGIDGTNRGDDALAFARLVAETTGAMLVLTRAYGTGEARDQARATLETRVADAGDVQVDLMPFADPSPARALQRVASMRHAGLVVVGSSHRARLGRIVPGSTGVQLLQDAPCAVAVVPHDWQPPAEAPLRRIGCAFDGSPEAQNALEAAVALARAADGELDVMRAFWSPPLSGPQGLAVTADLEIRAGIGLGRAVQSLPADVHPRARLFLKDPADALVARSPDLDVLIMGSRGHSRGPVAARGDPSPQRDPIPADIVMSIGPRPPEHDSSLGIAVTVSGEGTPTNRFVTIGDSITHGFMSAAIHRTELSWPAIVAYELGLELQADGKSRSGSAGTGAAITMAALPVLGSVGAC